jgi:hypothetical protein
MNLNPDEDKLLKKTLEEITIEQICGGSLNIPIDNALETMGKSLLKDEWERVKAEAGETRKKRKEIFRQMNSIKQYKKQDIAKLRNSSGDSEITG